MHSSKLKNNSYKTRAKEIGTSTKDGGSKTGYKRFNR